MRDKLCQEGNCKKWIGYNEKFLMINKEEIKNIKADMEKGIERYTKNNLSIIEETYLDNFISGMKIIRGNYSIGENVNIIEDDFEKTIRDLEKILNQELDYLNLLWMVALGILLETDKQNMKRLAKIVERQEMNDFVIDYLLCASDIGWTTINHTFFKEAPYTKAKEIIDLAHTDKKAASERLYTYMEKEWFQGHYDYEWRNAHKEPGYVGFWSFETAAIAKILGLDDENLKDNIHYPYDLAHYKNDMTFKNISLDEYLEKPVEENPDTWIEGIDNNPALENVIPGRWHAFVNDLISDYQNLNDDQFYDKYQEPMELEQIWFYKDEYKEENEEKNQLGTLIVFALAQRDYILQLDYKEDLEDYIHIIKDFWKNTETKLIEFDLGDDQHYYARVPVTADLDNMYEVDIRNVSGIKN